WADLAALGTLAVFPRTRPAEVIARCEGATAIITNKVMIGADVLATPGLRYVGVSATGTNVVDLAAAAARGVAVTNVPGYAAASVAQHAFSPILHFAGDVAGHSG